MTEDKINRLAQEIYAQIGGPDNVIKLIHCMTRVRLTIRDYAQVDIAGLKALDGVMGVVEDDTLQVVIGPGKVNKVAQAMVDTVGVKLGEPFPNAQDLSFAEQTAQNKVAAKNQYNKPSKFKAVLKAISNIFVPLIPAFVGAGIIAGIASVLGNLITAGSLDANQWGQIVTVLNIIKNGIFGYLAIYTGINAATEFGATPGLGGVLGATTLLAGMNPEQPLINIFDGQALAAGQGGIIGVIFAVWVLSRLEKRLHKIIPDAVDIIVTPTITLLVMGLFTIFLVMPVAGWISAGLVGGITWVLNVGGAVSGFILGAAFLPMVMFGLHQILTPIHLEMIAKTGSTQLLPILAMAGAGQVGAAFALWYKLKQNKVLANNIKGALPVGILGIGEPLIYGVTLPMGRPFITACLGGGIGGAIIGAFGNTGAIAIGPSGVALIPLIAHGRWWVYCLGLLGGYLGGFVVTYCFGIPKDEISKAQNYAVEHPVTTVQTADEVLMVMAPVNGTVVALNDLADPVFAGEMMGKGLAIEPSDGEFVAPVDGIVTSVFPTQHAIGITSHRGIEILMHIGLNTVKLAGMGYTQHVQQGQTIKVGDPLVTVDLPTVRAMGYAVTTPVIILNTAEYQSVGVNSTGTIQRGAAFIKIVK
ncbi:MAG: glucose PTS transporter subunit IIA [Lactobacillaceae bacterium]|jgi:PTS system sucrose-specific IIC component|nr:glucose PTS transporter subunit IIA [Lactobacillaceae bacterium]